MLFPAITSVSVFMYLFALLIIVDLYRGVTTPFIYATASGATATAADVSVKCFSFCLGTPTLVRL